jgi:hypothetical protein
MTTPSFTPPPTAPNRGMTDSAFVAAGNGFVAWFATLYAELVALVVWLVTTAAQTAADALSSSGSATAAAASAAAAVAGTPKADTSASSLSPTVSAKAVTLASAANTKTFANGERGILIRLSDPNTWIAGPISSASMGSAPPTLTITPATSADVSGSGGPYTDWLLLDAALAPLPAATVAQILAGVANRASVSPAALLGAAAPVALSYAATVNIDLNAGENFVIGALTGNLTLTFSNLQAGKSGFITLKQDGTGSRTWSVPASLKMPGGTVALSTPASTVDLLVYYVEDAVTPALRGVLLKAFS